METQAVLCVPREDEMEVISSTQAVSKTQSLVASVLGMPASRVVARVKRMGGGFGGKETRYYFASSLCLSICFYLFYFFGFMNMLLLVWLFAISKAKNRL